MVPPGNRLAPPVTRPPPSWCPRPWSWPPPAGPRSGARSTIPTGERPARRWRSRRESQNSSYISHWARPETARQRRSRSLLRHLKERAGLDPPHRTLEHQGSAPQRPLRLHRGLLQPPAHPAKTRAPKPHRLRESSQLNSRVRRSGSGPDPRHDSELDIRYRSRRPPLSQETSAVARPHLRQVVVPKRQRGSAGSWRTQTRGCHRGRRHWSRPGNEVVLGVCARARATASCVPGIHARRPRGRPSARLAPSCHHHCRRGPHRRPRMPLIETDGHRPSRSRVSGRRDQRSRAGPME